MSKEESLVVCLGQEAALLAGTEEVYRQRRLGFEDALVTQMDRLMVADFRGAILERKILLAVLERIGELHGKAPLVANRDSIDSQVNKFLNGVIHLARLRTMRHDVLQGAMVIADGYDIRQQPRMPKQWGLGPPGFVTPENQLWKRLTRIHLGTGADAFTDEEDFLRAVGESDPTANLYALAQDMGLALLPFANHEDYQIHKIYAPITLARCAKLTLPELERLDAALEYLIAEGNTRRSDLMRKTGRAPRISAVDFERRLQTAGLVDVSAKIIANAGSPTLVPLMFRHGMNYVFSPNQALVFRRLLQTYAANLTNTTMAARAGKGFEVLVARSLERCGLTTRHNGDELVSISLAKKNGFEIDAIGFNATRVYLVDAKYEMEPPGAWSQQNIKGRQDQLAKHRANLLAKVPHWEKRLAEPSPRLRLADDTEIRLPGPLLPGRTVVPLVLSARLEPALPVPGNVVSLVPPRAAEVMHRNLPMQNFMPVWTMDAPP